MRDLTALEEFSLIHSYLDEMNIPRTETVPGQPPQELTLTLLGRVRLLGRQAQDGKLWLSKLIKLEGL